MPLPIMAAAALAALAGAGTGYAGSKMRQRAYEDWQQKQLQQKIWEKTQLQQIKHAQDTQMLQAMMGGIEQGQVPTMGGGPQVPQSQTPWQQGGTQAPGTSQTQPQSRMAQGQTTQPAQSRQMQGLPRQPQARVQGQSQGQPQLPVPSVAPGPVPQTTRGPVFFPPQQKWKKESISWSSSSGPSVKWKPIRASISQSMQQMLGDGVSFPQALAALEVEGLEPDERKSLEEGYFYTNWIIAGQTLKEKGIDISNPANFSAAQGLAAKIALMMGGNVPDEVQEMLLPKKPQYGSDVQAYMDAEKNPDVKAALEAVDDAKAKLTAREEAAKTIAKEQALQQVLPGMLNRIAQEAAATASAQTVGQEQGYGAVEPQRQDRLKGEAQATSLGRMGAEAYGPLSGEKAMQANVQPGTTYSDIAASGKRVLTEREKENLNRIEGSKTTLTILRDLALGTDTEPGIMEPGRLGVLGRILKNGQLKWDKLVLNQVGRKLVRYENYIEGLTKTLNTVAGELGSRISDYDAQMVRKLPPALTGAIMANEPSQVSETFKELFALVARLERQLSEAYLVDVGNEPQGFVVGKTYTDADGNSAIYQADGTWKEVKEK